MKKPSIKKLPIGIQNLAEIIQQGYVYVDKTSYAKKLIDTGKHYFLSRPRRFGKSLFLDTLEEIFSGNEKLFEGLSIANSDYQWEKYPVLHFSFSSMALDNSGDLMWSLKRYLDDIAQNYSLQLEGPLAYRLSTLIKYLARENKVVILVDEYDKPIIDQLENEELADAHRKILRGFFTVLKDMDKFLKFTFITGISRFSRASLFSGFNNLKDISLDKRYSELMGYTHEEMQLYFQEHLKSIAEQQSETEKEQVLPELVLEQMREWYNGYLFSEDGKKVYNPFSSMSFLDSGKMFSYWYNTGTPSFLIREVKKHPDLLTSLEGISLSENKLSDIIDVKNIFLPALMFQAGYLTLKDYNPQNKQYTLNFPNQEVKRAFHDSLLTAFTLRTPEASRSLSQEVIKSLKDMDVDTLIQHVNQHFSAIPYYLFIEAKEAFYHTVLLNFLNYLGIATLAEVPTHVGRIDLVSQVPGYTLVFEIKLDKSCDEAFEQIEEKNYLSPYLHKEKKLLALGCNFCSKERVISDWKAQLYSSEGELIKKLD